MEAFCQLTFFLQGVSRFVSGWQKATAQSHVGKLTLADLCRLHFGKGCLKAKQHLLKTSDIGIIEQGYTEGWGGGTGVFIGVPRSLMGVRNRFVGGSRDTS